MKPAVGGRTGTEDSDFRSVSRHTASLQKLGRVDRVGQEQLVKEQLQEHGSYSPDRTATQKEATKAATASPMGKYQIFAGIISTLSEVKELRRNVLLKTD